MSDPLEPQARRAAATVRERARTREVEGDLGAVRRRAGRPRAPHVVAVLVLLALAIPLSVLALSGGAPLIELAPADQQEVAEPQPTAPTPPTTENAPPTSGASPSESNAPILPSSDPSPDREPSDDSLPTTSPSPPATGPDALGEGSTAERSTLDFPMGGDFAQLVDVRVARQETFDRIVLEFATEAEPSYRIRYVHPPITQDGSGDEVAVDGEAFIELILTPASGVTMDTDAPEGFERTYTGPDRIRLDSGTVAEVVRTGDFEATLSWVIGVERTTPFSVTWLTSPRRLVIDVQHG